ncbi:MAG: NTP transferase domain-containing protein, partial [Polyangiales bacterium]
MSDSRPLTAIVLAAGQGKRMHSPHPKVLLPLAGRPMLQWTLAAVFDSQVDACIVVVGHQGDAVAADAESAFPDKLRFARQEAQRGTADAVRCALPALSHKDGHVLILYGDCPLIEGRQLHALIDAGRKAAGPLAMLTTHTDAPEGYGRIIRSGVDA